LPDENEPERELVSRKRGKELAENWAKKPKKLGITDTLLSSKDITAVVAATGLISPFYTGGGRKARLKKASYEGRAGSKAYLYKEINSPEIVFESDKHKYLRIPKNSIVFVESDLDFRLPDFIALRFNLQIQHVHRGLLLGTGPLVDPGFWGKLCIPLHNLTDEDYDIPKDEGLIWVEFTKTTLSSDKTDDARVALEASTRDEKGHWDILEFLHKAANQYTGHKVPIRSSLPTMFGEAIAAAEKSARDAEAAKEDAKSALEVADKFKYWNNFAMIAAAVGFLGICFAALNFLFNLSSRNEEIAGAVKAEAEAAHSSIEEHVIDVDRYGLQAAEVRASVPSLRRKVEQQQREIADLKKQTAEIKGQLDRLEDRPNVPPYLR
jgi:deoxycytidine triphosphate deaminase